MSLNTRYVVNIHTYMQQSGTLMHIHILWGKILANFASFKDGPKKYMNQAEMTTRRLPYYK